MVTGPTLQILFVLAMFVVLGSLIWWGFVGGVREIREHRRKRLD